MDYKKYGIGEREIKFRAWLKEQRIMISNPSNIEFRGSYSGSVSVYWEIDHYGTRDGGVYLDNNIIITQFSGLKDKNGKEIYEGDIVFDETYRINYICGFRDGMFCLNSKDRREILPDEFIKDGMSFEIIGNIFENPKLIDNK